MALITFYSVIKVIKKNMQKNYYAKNRLSFEWIKFKCLKVKELRQSQKYRISEIPKKNNDFIDQSVIYLKLKNAYNLKKIDETYSQKTKTLKLIIKKLKFLKDC